MFTAAYAALNSAQKTAVDSIYGPVLVIAGPGTGKTQLLSARVAHILQVTDALAQNILCLTFTESGATNMRERLASFIGQDAYDVQIATYHAFGSSIISRFPEYFTDLRLERPIDELGKRQILSEIIDSIDYKNPIKQVRHHLGDLVSTISEVKRGLLSPDDLRKLCAENSAIIQQTRGNIASLLEPYAARLPSKLSVSEPVFQKILASIQSNVPASTNLQRPSLAYLAAAELETALSDANAIQKTTPLTKWKNTWLQKDDQNRYLLAGTLESKRIAALADVLEAYQLRLNEKGLYDFDDMILRAIEVLEHHDELRYTLQEQYQFILLDEFQDTNAAQLKLVQLLTDNPAHEGKPNILAVGDDDQAIYAFQGALYSNMLDFYRLYKDVQVITLEENYRSQVKILQAAQNIAAQIEARLHHNFEGVSKQLRAVRSEPSDLILTRQSYVSTIAERTGVAAQIHDLIRGGSAPERIVVLAPKHKYLEPLVPYLQQRDIPVSYEKRENILEAPVVRELLTMSKLILALHEGKQSVANALWPEVLSYDFWDFSTSAIWEVSWQANDRRTPWSKLLLESPEFKHAALLMLTLAGKVETESVEFMLDALIGTSDVQTHDRELPSVRSSLREYYFAKNGEGVLYETVTQLTVLRAKLREHTASERGTLGLADLLAFVDAYAAAEQPMLNTSPYSQSSAAVQLMTVFKAKGLEFDHVFLIACDDSVWGTKATGVGNKLTLPANLASIRHAGSTDDERLRLLYVAVTRARYGLHLTSHEKTFSGKETTPIKYFDERSGANEVQEIHILPEGFTHIERISAEQPSLEALTLNWQQRHYHITPPLAELLSHRLKRYQLSATHLTHFLDLKYGGPESFLLGTILRFPSAPSVDTIFGNAIHETLQWIQGEVNRTAKLPSMPETLRHTAAYLEREPLTPEQMVLQTSRAQHALSAYLTNEATKFVKGNVAEKSFRDEGVFIGDVHLGGKIDLLVVDNENKSITVVDYKTGQLGSDPIKLHRYTLQLYCYKLLVENSRTYRGYSVEAGKLVFVEPTANGAIISKEIAFTDKHVQRTKQLLTALWRRVITLDMPSTDGFGDSLKDSIAFEDMLIG